MPTQPSSLIDYKRLFEFSPGLFLLLDTHFNVLAASNAYLQGTMTKREEIIGKNIFVVFPDNPNDPVGTGSVNLRASLKQVLKTKRSDTMAVQKYDIPRSLAAGGGFEVRYWSPVNSPILNDNGDVEYILHRAEDVTNFVLQNQRGIDQEKQMEFELYQRAQELQVTNQKLRAAEQLKSEFLATMSHEIRTPMNGIMGMTDLILMTNLNSTQRSYAKVIQDSCSNLLTIINDILDFSKIEAGRLDFEIINFSVVQTVENQSDLLATKYKPKGLSFATFIDPRIPTHLLGDPGRIGQVLINLIGNAIKFTSTGYIFVEAKLMNEQAPYDDQGPCTIKFSVTDTGVGIPSASIPLLFEPFIQADSSTTRKFGGTGLGLSISKKLVQLMNGEIGVESKEGQGSCFWFTIPLKKGDSSADATQKPRADLHNFKILIAEQDNNDRRVLHDYLTSWSASNSHTANAAGCLDLLQREAEQGRPFDVVLIGLGEESLAVAQKVSANPHLSKTKLIFIKGHNQIVSDEDLKNLGFAATITKAFKQSQIFNCIVSTMSPKTFSTDEHIKQVEFPYVGTNKGRVLIVDDNLVNQMVAKALLEAIGYTSAMASNGKEAIQQLEMSDFDLILMDCQMPVMDGFEATRFIRALNDSVKSRVPIIALTANAMRDDEELCLSAGMNDYLSKPIRKDILERKLKYWIVKSN